MAESSDDLNVTNEDTQSGEQSVAVEEIGPARKRLTIEIPPDRIADALEAMGVDVIEAGFPIASRGDFEAVEAISRTVTESTVCGWPPAPRGTYTVRGTTGCFASRPTSSSARARSAGR